MDPATPYYYAFSTIAQVAAALAALIGFLGLWRIDKLGEERERLGHYIRWMLHGKDLAGAEVTVLPHDRLFAELSQVAAARFPGEDAEHVQELTEKLLRQIDMDVQHRWRAIPGDRQRLIHALYRFLILTLVVLVAAVVLLVFVGVLSTRAWTAWMLTGFAILMSLALGIGPLVLIREAARSTEQP
jgi:hypothetical protein